MTQRVSSALLLVAILASAGVAQVPSIPGGPPTVPGVGAAEIEGMWRRRRDGMVLEIRHVGKLKAGAMAGWVEKGRTLRLVIQAYKKKYKKNLIFAQGPLRHLKYVGNRKYTAQIMRFTSSPASVRQGNVTRYRDATIEMRSVNRFTLTSNGWSEGWFREFQFAQPGQVSATWIQGTWKDRSSKMVVKIHGLDKFETGFGHFVQTSQKWDKFVAKYRNTKRKGLAHGIVPYEGKANPLFEPNLLRKVTYRNNGQWACEIQVTAGTMPVKPEDGPAFRWWPAWIRKSSANRIEVIGANRQFYLERVP